MPRRGFTLLEVLVAVAILGLGLTVVLSAQTGVFWSYSRSRHLSQAPGQLRCKMAEIEVELLKMGYPILEETDDGPCCDDEFTEGYTCEWKIQKVVLPELPLSDPFGATGGDGGLSDSPAMQGAGALTALAGLQQGGAAASGGGGVGDIADMMGSGASVGGIAPMVMGLVYPDLKPMLEASIRKITVSVKWQEGSFERDLTATQYVTSPQQGGFDPLAAEGLADSAESLIGDVLGGAGVEAPATGDKP